MRINGEVNTPLFPLETSIGPSQILYSHANDYGKHDVVLGGKHLGEVRVFKCVICGWSATSKLALMGHVRKHRGEFKRLSVSLPVKDVDWFKEFCRRHNSTTCHMLKTIIDAFRKGDELGVVHIGGANPVVINVNTTFLGKPRGVSKVLLPRESYRWPPSCIHADEFIKSAKEVGCSRGKEWLSLEECWRCFQAGCVRS